MGNTKLIIARPLLFLRENGTQAHVVGNRPSEALVIAATTGDPTQADTCRVTVTRPAGDTTADGFTDVDDLNAIINVMLGKAPEPEAADLPFYDLNGDGRIDVDDMNRLINLMLGVPDGGKAYTVAGVTFRMVTVEGGTFTMGATAEQGSDAYDDEKPAHQVTLSSFSIGQTEVTQELWQAVMGTNPSYFQASTNLNYGTNLQRPVECVSWNDCQKFLAKLNALTGQNFRLPTEAEWEYAARGGTRSQGYKYAGSDNLDDVAWYWYSIPSRSEDTAGYGTQTVATKSPNELGLYDMSGNVWEWCQDWYGSYSSEAQTNPTGPDTGSYRVYRGGGWNDDAGGCLVAARDIWYADFRDRFLGFRLAL